MRFKEFRIGDEVITSPIEIDDVLIKNNLNWLIDSEIEEAIVEIKFKTLIWKNGKYFAGNWEYGIWQDGYFYGVWENGIWENGNFEGKWKSGINNQSEKI